MSHRICQKQKKRRLAAFGSVIADRVAGVTAMLMLACLATLAPMGAAPWWMPALPWFALGSLFLVMAMLPRLANYSTKVGSLLVGIGWEQGRWENRGNRHVWVDGTWRAGASAGPVVRERREQGPVVRDHREEKKEERHDQGPIVRDHR